MLTSKLERRQKPDLELLAARVSAALVRPRPLSAQVLQHLLTDHEIEASDVPQWFRDNVSELESYEFDLLLSPMFTPTFERRVEIERVLGESWLEAQEVEALLENLAERRLSLTLLQDGDSVVVPLPQVIAARFVRLLHLDVPPPLVEGEGECPSLSVTGRALLRDRTWHRPQSKSLLPTLLRAVERAAAVKRAEIDKEEYLRFVTDFVRSHRPSSRADCATYLGSLADAYEEDLRKHESGSRSFFNDELKATHGGTRVAGDQVLSSHKRSIAMARALQGALS